MAATAQESESKDLPLRSTQRDGHPVCRVAPTAPARKNKMSSPPQTTTAAAGPSSSSATPASGAPGGPGDAGPPGISRSSSLLFGFLITFLVLFVAFMACGYTSRRSVELRRRLRTAGAAPHGGARPLEKRGKPPHLWDVWIGGGQATWRTMMPLSAAMKCPLAENTLSAPLAALQEHAPPYVGATGGRGAARAPTPVARRARTPPSPRARSQTHPSSPPHTPPHILQNAHAGAGRTGQRRGPGTDELELRVAVLIAMPRPPPPPPPRGAGGVVEEARPPRVAEYGIGLADVRVAQR
ncbi:hypothetical protein DFH11DRAFT_1748535 [Phellopilus nigrolimitatus]|nr:hypothetical protein DFH11DRAFT_1748535 [Phellopilus nigrolimitatus]